jgi:spore coat protein CotF
VLQELTGLTGTKITDEVIASDMLASGKLHSMALTMATLEAATPELRQAFQENLNGCLEDHFKVYRLAQERGWYKAFEDPEAQVEMDRRKAEGAAHKG